MKLSKKIKKDSEESEDDLSDNSNELNTDNSPKLIPIARLGDKLKTKKIIINVSDTQYPIVQEVAEQMGWIVQSQPGLGDWDVWWTDRQINPDGLFRMHMHQKINHYPGIYVLARKNMLGLHLMGMKERFPEEYSFFPETWIIPLQFPQFRQYYQSTPVGKARTYIVKPQAMSQGRGIFLTRNIEDIATGHKYVVQRYVKNPFLIEGLKFDLRIYVLIAGTQPMRIYLYQQGLTRFATEKYVPPTDANLSHNYVHLTNYSLNKSNPNFIYNTSDKEMDKGHKRTLSSTYQKLQKMGYDVDKLKLQIEDVIVKTAITGLPLISHYYRWSQPEDYESNLCFHILGFDVMLKQDLTPVIIQVNHTPSFETGTPLDYFVKKKLIKDTFTLLRITQANKKVLFNKAKVIMKKRLQTGKRQIYKGQQRQTQIDRAQQIRDKAQQGLLGGYKKIHPVKDILKQQKYDKFIQTAIIVQKQTHHMRKKLLKQQKQQLSTNKKNFKKETQESKKNQNKFSINNTSSDFNNNNCQKRQAQSLNTKFRTKVTKRRQPNTYDQSSLNKFNMMMEKVGSFDQRQEIFNSEKPVTLKSNLITMKDIFMNKNNSCRQPKTNTKQQFQSSKGCYITPKNYQLVKKHSQGQKDSRAAQDQYKTSIWPKNNTKFRRFSIF